MGPHEHEHSGAGQEAAQGPLEAGGAHQCIGGRYPTGILVPMPEPARPASPRKALLVIKPVPVPELGGDPAPHIVRRLGQAGMACDVVTTRRDLSAFEVVRGALTSTQPPDVVIAAGGDGTHGPAGAALAGTAIPLGLVSLGTFNNLARSIAVPRDVDT